MRSGDPGEEPVRQPVHEMFLRHSGDVLMQTVNGKMVDFVPTPTKPGVRGQQAPINEPGSFAWFWASANMLADETPLAVRPPDQRSSDRDSRMAA